MNGNSSKSKIVGRPIADVVHPAVAYPSTIAKLLLNWVSAMYLVEEFAADADEGQVFKRRIDDAAETRRNETGEKIGQQKQFVKFNGYLSAELEDRVDGPYCTGNYIVFTTKDRQHSMSFTCPPMIPYGDEAQNSGGREHVKALTSIVLETFKNVRAELVADAEKNGEDTPTLSAIHYSTVSELQGSSQFRDFPFYELGTPQFSHMALCAWFHNRHEGDIIPKNTSIQELDFEDTFKASRTWLVTDAQQSPHQIALQNFWGQYNAAYIKNGFLTTSR